MVSEKRLIDANKIVEVAEHAYKEWNLAMAAADGQRQINQVYKMKELCKAVKAVADAAPTVDAAPVVHGQWRRFINGDGEYKYLCSVCEKMITYEMGGAKYCPDCGAKMDGGNDV